MTTTAPYQLLPDLTPEEYAALKADINGRGIMVPVEVDEVGQLLDGHQRVRAWNELRAEGKRVPDYPRLIRAGLTEDQKFEHALVLNLQRRHLSAEQRRELTRTLRERGWSTRRIAAIEQVSDGTVRNDLSGAQNYAPERVEGHDGKSYPARKTTTVLATSRRQEERVTSTLAANPDAAKGGWSAPVDFKPPLPHGSAAAPDSDGLHWPADTPPLSGVRTPRYSGIVPGVCPHCAAELILQCVYHPDSEAFTAYFIPPEKMGEDWYPEDETSIPERAR